MVNPIMTTTLPTIVGMGVVSRTTETMFSKKRRSAKVAKMTKKQRSAAAKKAWRTRRKRYGKDGVKG